ncbi:MAG: hypothetical protein K6G83_06930 [Lachnospiraceae bacterium]|nr:hypothetical protein [Lachnospiraceae bacterium]
MGNSVIETNNTIILTLECEDDIQDYLREIEVVFSPKESNATRFHSLFSMFRYPVTVVCEKDYVDKTYRDTYYTYFASKHRRFDKNCKRLSFFEGIISEATFYKYDEEDKLQRAFIGVCIVRPLKIGAIGRTLLDPKRLAVAESYVRTTRYDFIILGHDLCVNAFPFSSQDSETMTCAETTVYNIIDYFGTRYPEYRTVLPSQLINELEKISQERILPSRGLDYYKISGLLKTFGFSPRVYAESVLTTDFKRTFHYYVESGIPLAVGVSAKCDGSDVKHSVVCIGHGKYRIELSNVQKHKIGEYEYIDTADLYDEYVMMDDNQIPYTVEKFDNLTIYDDAQVVLFAVPLYKRAFLEARDASDLFREIFEHERLGFLEIIPRVEEVINDDNPLVTRIFLTSSRKYRRYRAKHAGDAVASQFYSTLQLPKFIWVGEISTYNSYTDNMIYGEIVIDATASRISHKESLIMVRYLDYIGYRLPDESESELNSRLRHKVANMVYPYKMYHNNLVACGGNDDTV